MRRVIVALICAVALVAASTTAASAASRTWTDSARDAGAQQPNITSVNVRNNANRLVVRATFKSLNDRAVGTGGTKLWIDTQGAGNPEFVVIGGLSRLGTDWQIFRANGWRPVGYPLPCAIGMGINHRAGTVQWSTGRSCLGRYGRVRVSLEASNQGRYDFSPARNRWHSYVKRG